MEMKFMVIFIIGLFSVTVKADNNAAGYTMPPGMNGMSPMGWANQQQMQQNLQQGPPSLANQQGFSGLPPGFTPPPFLNQQQQGQGMPKMNQQDILNGMPNSNSQSAQSENPSQAIDSTSSTTKKPKSKKLNVGQKQIHSMIY